MRRVTGIVISLFCSFLFMAGCSPAISKAVRAQVSEGVTLLTVKDRFDAFEGKIVLWGGVIVKTTHQKNGTLVEIVQKPTNYQGRPKEVDLSEGRFLALYDGYLDAAIYEAGREVTVAGKILGEKVLPLDEIDYRYPLLQVEEIHLWPPRVDLGQYPYGGVYMHYPYWGYFYHGWAW